MYNNYLNVWSPSASLSNLCGGEQYVVSPSPMFFSLNNYYKLNTLIKGYSLVAGPTSITIGLTAANTT
jgi:hypothetical protein